MVNPFTVSGVLAKGFACRGCCPGSSHVSTGVRRTSPGAGRLPEGGAAAVAASPTGSVVAREPGHSPPGVGPGCGIVGPVGSQLAIQPERGRLLLRGSASPRPASTAGLGAGPSGDYYRSPRRRTATTTGRSYRLRSLSGGTDHDHSGSRPGLISITVGRDQG